MNSPKGVQDGSYSPIVLYVTLLSVLVAIGLAVVLALRRREHRSTLSTLAEAAGGSGDPPSEATLLSSIEDLHRRIRTAEHQAEVLTAAVSAADLGILVVNGAGEVVFANPAAQRYLGARHGDAVAGVRLEEMITDVVSHGTESSRSIEVYSPRKRHLELQSMPLAGTEFSGGAVIFIDDLTERARIQAMRRDFVANVSHELKTPLGALQLLADAITASTDPAVHSRLVGRLREESGRLTSLIDDILDLTTIEDTTPERSPIALRRVLEASLEKTRLLAETYGIDVELDNGGETVLSGDERQLVSAVGNLIENAIKYTKVQDPDAPGTVWVRGHADADFGVVEVEDHGIGIPSQHLDRIFERFYRVDRGRSRETGGTGLGLAIVRHVVENHGGRVEVESRPGEGSVFRISIPVWRQ